MNKPFQDLNYMAQSNENRKKKDYNECRVNVKHVKNPVI